jgi:RimJ/RimL family protein N-acetyltransferase
MNDSVEMIRTERLRGERMALTHWDDLRRLHRDPEVMRTLSADGQVLPDEDIRARIDEAIEHWENHGFGFWVFYDQSDGRFVGRGGLKFFTIDGEREVGLAYAVMSGLWGRGFATEMAEASVSIGFERLGLSEVGSWTLPINRASSRVMEKLGFLYEREFEFAGLPHKYYRRRAEGWRGRSPDIGSTGRS